MKPEIKEKWLKALRSGEYSQGSGCLKQTDSGTEKVTHCCLGVLCEIYLEETRETWGDSSELYESLGVLNKKVVEWAGLPDSNPDIPTKVVAKIFHQEVRDDKSTFPLAVLNDHWANFNQIADIIEEVL